MCSSELISGTHGTTFTAKGSAADTPCGCAQNLVRGQNCHFSPQENALRNGLCIPSFHEFSLETHRFKVFSL